MPVTFDLCMVRICAEILLYLALAAAAFVFAVSYRG